MPILWTKQNCAVLTVFESFWTWPWAFHGSEVFQQLLLIESFQAKLQDLSNSTKKEFSVSFSPFKLGENVSTSFLLLNTGKHSGNLRQDLGQCCHFFYCALHSEGSNPGHSSPTTSCTLAPACTAQMMCCVLMHILGHPTGALWVRGALDGYNIVSYFPCFKLWLWLAIIPFLDHTSSVCTSKRNPNSVGHFQGKEGLTLVSGTGFPPVGGWVGSSCHFPAGLLALYTQPLIQITRGNLSSLGNGEGRNWNLVSRTTRNKIPI